jgi:glycosyltransferase involved in cell wall biosynthesis
LIRDNYLLQRSAYLQRQQTGFLMPPEDPAKLAQLIQQILDLPAEKKIQIKQAAHRRVEQHFNKTVMLEKTLNIYQQLLNKPL